MNTDNDKYRKALSGWTELNNMLTEFTIGELQTLLDFEVSGDNRQTYVKRIHQRIVRLQNQIDREHLLGE